MSPLPPRTVAVIGAVCLTVGWLLASTLSPPVARLQTLPERQPRPASSTEEAGFTEQLHLRLQQAPVAPTPRRNPFVFGQVRPTTATSAPAAEPPSSNVPPSPTATVPLAPSFTLAGMAVTGETRTAILSDEQDVHLVTVGDRIGGYDIVEMTDHSVTLAEPSGLRWVLRMR